VRIDGLSALVTGGASGLGLATARRLLELGASVTLLDLPGAGGEAAALARLRDDIRKGLEESVPHPKRLGAPEDFAHLAVSLIENRYINGETIRLDGAIRMAPR
jgi:NAD(P)-dependent dehydrogenase (short-subunit alcohol dehydrogenase family)